MKKSVSAIVVLSTLLATASWANRISPEIRLGVGFSKQDFTYQNLGESQFDWYTGYDLGLSAGIRITESWRLSVGLLYTQRGYTAKDNEAHNGNVVTGRIEAFAWYVEYLSVPLLITTDMPIGPGHLYSIIGPRIDYKTGSGGDFASELEAGYLSIVYGGVVGLGNQFPINEKLSILMEVRYNFDFTKAYETDNLVIKNKSMGLLAGLRVW